MTSLGNVERPRCIVPALLGGTTSSYLRDASRMGMCQHQHSWDIAYHRQMPHQGAEHRADLLTHQSKAVKHTAARKPENNSGSLENRSSYDKEDHSLSLGLHMIKIIPTTFV